MNSSIARDRLPSCGIVRNGVAACIIVVLLAVDGVSAGEARIDRNGNMNTTMRKPIIGITAGKRSDGSVGVPADYIDAVVRSGGTPLLLPPMDDLNAVAAMVKTVDGLLLSGGGDIVPKEYGEQPHPKTASQDAVRDRTEFAATRAAMERRIPILGICRGVQVLNVALGGTLVQDVPSQVPHAASHHTGDNKTALPHTVKIEPDTLLARVLGTTDTGVTSRHHQAVKDVAAGLRINCQAPDGVIEGLEAADGRSILAVQCHPESCCTEHPIFQKLFDWLVAEAGKKP